MIETIGIELVGKYMNLKCDWKGCKNPAFAEVDYETRKGKWVWSNLCLPHFLIEYTFRGKEFGWLLSQVWYSHFWNSAWKVLARIPFDSLIRLGRRYTYSREVSLTREFIPLK